MNSRESNQEETPTGVEIPLFSCIPRGSKASGAGGGLLPKGEGIGWCHGSPFRFRFFFADPEGYAREERVARWMLATSPFQGEYGGDYPKHGPQKGAGQSSIRNLVTKC
jgi:hypothetical protein